MNSAVWSPYVSSVEGTPHSGSIVESTTLASIPLPPIQYTLGFEPKGLSSLQVETIVYAGARHQHILASGHRCGFFLGDSAGIGKGRQLAGIIWDNMVRGTRRCLWVSTSKELKPAAEADFRDIGAHVSLVEPPLNGVYFCTYATLAKNYESIREWLEPDSVIVFDECHEAKNLTGTSGSKAALAVARIQDDVKLARVVYSSATGISDIRHMAYIRRMGLWGPGTQFDSYEGFRRTLGDNLSVLEMLAMDLKSTGAFVSRSIGLHGVEVDTVTVRVEDIKRYDQVVDLWNEIYCEMLRAFRLCTSNPDRKISLEWVTGNTTPRKYETTYWAAHQTFMKQYTTALKVPVVKNLVHQALDQGMCAIVGIQHTGSSSDLDSSAEHTMRQFVQRWIPTHRAWMLEPGDPDRTDHLIPLDDLRLLVARILHTQRIDLHVTNRIVEFLYEHPLVPGYTPDGKIMECVSIQRRLLGKIARLRLPRTTLDELLELPDVVELTGRNSKREVAQREFMQGRKRVAIVSDAASTGISLHDTNKRRRMHITMELPWTAEQAIQQLGRSHRTNQYSAPIYKLVTTELGGENRFTSAVAKRLQSMGALTRGDRNASGTAGMDLGNGFDNPYGSRALSEMVGAVLERRIPEEIWSKFDASLDVLKVPMCRVMPLKLGKTWIYAPDENALEARRRDVSRFMNRLFSLRFADQQRVFALFQAFYDRAIQQDRDKGVYSEGVERLEVSFTRMAPPRLLARNPGTGSCLMLHHLERDRGLAFEDAVGGEFRVRDGRVFLAIEDGGVRIVRPKTGWDGATLGTLAGSEPCPDPRELWEKEYNCPVCYHGTGCCEQGRRKDPFYLLTGDAVGHWCRLMDLLHGEPLKVVSIRSLGLVGVVFPGTKLAELETSIKGVHQPSVIHVSLRNYEVKWRMPGLSLGEFKSQPFGRDGQMRALDFYVEDGVVKEVGPRAFKASGGRLKPGFRTKTPNPRAWFSPNIRHTFHFEFRRSEEDLAEERRFIRDGLIREEPRPSKRMRST